MGPIANFIDRLIQKLKMSKLERRGLQRRSEPRLSLDRGHVHLKLPSSENSVEFDLSDISKNGFGTSPRENVKVQIGDLLIGTIHFKDKEYQVDCQVMHISDDKIGFEIQHCEPKLELHSFQ